MSRAQKNVRLKVGSPAPESGTANQLPEGVTQKDGATNIAGDVTAFTADQYTGLKRVVEPPTSY